MWKPGRDPKKVEHGLVNFAGIDTPAAAEVGSLRAKLDELRAVIRRGLD